MRNSLKRHPLKESEIKRAIDEFRHRLNVDLEDLFGSKPRIELVETQEIKIFIHNKVPFSAEIGDNLFPTLLFEETLPLLPRIVIDMGAIPHVCNGADIMAPGVVRIDGEFGENAFVLVVDERHGKPLAIGKALHDSKIMKATKRGKVVKNMHYVGDEVWNLTRRLVP